MAVVEHLFQVMGSTAHVVVDGSAGMAEVAIRRLEQLHSIWTRFDPDSEVSRIGLGAGEHVPVSPDTITLVARSVDAWLLTDGRFDPTVATAMVRAGYATGRDAHGGAGTPTSTPGATPGCAGIEIDRSAGTVRVPPGTTLDAGGIGKGLAADLVCEEIMSLGATGVMVNVGGDLRVMGGAPGPRGWTVGIDSPYDGGGSLAILHIADGGVATSTPVHRRWRIEGRPAVHLIDPGTGRPATTDVASATVIAAHGWMAEAFAKAAALEGAGAACDLIDDAGLSGIVVDTAGAMSVAARLGAFL